jgi:hypothetical protein
VRFSHPTWEGRDNTSIFSETQAAAPCALPLQKKRPFGTLSWNRLIDVIG